KTDDGYFLGFPSLWNVVAFYLYALRLPAGPALGVLAALSLLTFVPSRYLYPSQPGPLNALSNVLGAVWAGLSVAVLWFLPADRPPAVGDPAWWLALASLFYPAFYMIASWTITVRRWRRGRRPLTPSEAAP